MSYSPNAPPPGQGAPPSSYQTSTGDPINQQSQEVFHGAASTGIPPPQQHGSQGLAGSYVPPPAQDSQHNSLPSAQAQQQYFPAPAQHGPGNAGMSSQIPQRYPPLPTQHTQEAPMPGQAPQQYPPPPTASKYTPAGPQLPGQSSQQYYPTPPTTMAAPGGQYGVPPKRQSAIYDDNPSNPINYTCDPHKLVAYLVPFPKPFISGVDASRIPDRFLIYTPPPPPLSAPKEGEKENKLHKVQRKWQEEVRAAKTSDAKVASWKGVKSRATKGISYVMSKTTTSNLDFVNRIPGAKADPNDPHAGDDVHEGDSIHKTVGLEEIVLVYPSSYDVPPEQVQTEFINTMMRTKSKAQRDAIIATGLLPVSGAIDLLATVVWPFGGLLEVDSVWAYSSVRGAKTARSVTKRLASSTHGETHHQTEEQEMAGDKLHLKFTQSPRLEVLQRYLVARCREYDPKLIPSTQVAPTEGEVLAAIGWAPSQAGSEEKNWEDEQWETSEVKDDMKNTLSKAAKEWDKWCKAFAKDPEKALKG